MHCAWFTLALLHFDHLAFQRLHLILHLGSWTERWIRIQYIIFYRKPNRYIHHVFAETREIWFPTNFAPTPLSRQKAQLDQIDHLGWWRVQGQVQCQQCQGREGSLLQSANPFPGGKKVLFPTTKLSEKVKVKEILNWYGRGRTHINLI